MKSEGFALYRPFELVLGLLLVTTGLYCLLKGKEAPLLPEIIASGQIKSGTKILPFEGSRRHSTTLVLGLVTCHHPFFVCKECAVKFQCPTEPCNNQSKSFDELYQLDLSVRSKMK